MMNEIPNSDAREARLDALIAEYFQRMDSGEHVEREAFLREHAEDSDELSQLLEMADRVDQMAGPTQGEEEHFVPDVSSKVGDALGETQSFDAAQLAGAKLTAAEPAHETLAFSVDTDLTNSSAERPEGSFDYPRDFGDYELLEIIGRGGMGVVFRARQKSMDRIVAVKMILAGRLASEEEVSRFHSEAQSAGRIGHPHIVTIHQIGEIEGHHFFSMDYIEGTDLADLTAEGPLEPRRAAGYLKTIAQALQAAHDKGILHRDLKPANVLIDRDDRPLLTDFGLAKHVEQEGGLTATGAAMGTPSYMAPEQAAGYAEQMGPASDVYSLGAILYVLLTGRPPFRRETVVQTILEVIHSEPAPPRRINPEADRDLETICLKCLHKNPAARYPSAQALADDLERYLADEPIQARPLSAWQRQIRWLADVPVIAAVSGRSVPNPTGGQQRAQAAFIFLLLLAGVLAVAARGVWKNLHERLPRTVKIATGTEGGMYDSFGQVLADWLQETAGSQVEVHPTSGSYDNIQQLLEGDAHLALLQQETIRDAKLVVVAPVFHEVVHVIVRRRGPIQRFEDLKGRNVWMGQPNTGMRLTAKAILTHYEIEPGRTWDDISFARIFDDPEMEAAIATVGLNNARIRELLATGDFQLLSLPDLDGFHHPALRTYVIDPDVYDSRNAAPLRPGGERPGQGAAEEGEVGDEREPQPPTVVRTVATVACLATRIDAPRQLVTATLDTLYSHSRPRIISFEEASQWPALRLHPAAIEYFEQKQIAVK